MKLKGQILFFTIVLILVASIVFLGFYNSQMKRLRKLENTVQATWGDVIWRLEERNEFLPGFVGMVKSKEPKLSSQVMKDKKALEEAIQQSNQMQIIYQTKDLDSSLKILLDKIDNSPEIVQEKQFKSMRRTMFDVEDRVDSHISSYNEAVGRFNKFLNRFWGRVVAPSVPKKIFFKQS